LRIAGTGFTPSGRLEITGTWVQPNGATRLAGTFAESADDSGAFVEAEETPSLHQGDRFRFRVTVDDLTQIAQGAPPSGQSASTTVTVSFFGAYFRPWYTTGTPSGRPGRTALLEVGGYIDSNSRILYVHYLRASHLIKTLRIGRLKGPCGALTQRFRQFDFRPVPAGTYNVSFDTTRAWPNDDKYSGYRRVVVH